MEALDAYYKSKKAIAKAFDTIIYEGIDDYRGVWWWLDGNEINWCDEKPEGDIDVYINSTGPQYSEHARKSYPSVCGEYTGFEMFFCTGDTSFAVFDKSKCISTEYEKAL